QGGYSQAPNVDQRGFERPIDGGIGEGLVTDIGAFEVQNNEIIGWLDENNILQIYTHGLVDIVVSARRLNSQDIVYVNDQALNITANSLIGLHIHTDNTVVRVDVSQIGPPRFSGLTHASVLVTTGTGNDYDIGSPLGDIINTGAGDDVV